ncbi:MAG TPA: hypothetical protein DC047_15300 [Blastocatellia bacterium]|nr:hypothetical protein [Blastocatellia bacterium]
MPLAINEAAFESCHQAFLAYVQEKAGGEPFTNFQHPFLVDDEISYKWAAYRSGRDALALAKWNNWKPGDGRIIEAVKAACAPSIGANWLTRRFGAEQGNSDAPLYLVKGRDQIRGLEEQLQILMLGGKDTPDAFGLRFDRFADYLRAKHLHCKWPFPSHLAFLLRPTTYFPVKPTPFQDLLGFYGLPDKVAGHVDWRRYSLLMELADWLRERLSSYGSANTVEIHSYMWVVAYLGPATIKTRKRHTSRDFDTELSLRQKRAMERERRGLMGERFVYEKEVDRLNRQGKTKLSGQVELVSFDCSVGGFDIKSYDDNGKEIHIEVKTTITSEAGDPGFWLSESERITAKKDPCWRLYRVWSIDDKPYHRDLGNVVRALPLNLQMEPSGWFVSRGDATEASELSIEFNGQS